MVQAKFTSEMIDCLRKLIGESFVSYDGAIMNQTAYEIYSLIQSIFL